METKDLLDYFWKYFELQSTQRNQTIGLYYTLVTALIGGFIVVAKLHMVLAEDIVLGSIIFVTIVFGIMFMRTTTLRNKARKHLEKLEECEITENFRIISTLEGSSSEGCKLFTYTYMQILQFLLVGVVAIIALIGVHTGILVFDV